MMNKPPYFVDLTQDCPDPQSPDLVSAARAAGVADRRRGVRARAELSRLRACEFRLFATAWCNMALLVRGVRLRFPQTGETGNRYGV